MIVIRNVAIGGLFQTKNYWKNYSAIPLCFADDHDIKRIFAIGKLFNSKKYYNLDFIHSIKLFSRFFVRIQSSLDFTMERLQSAHAVRSQKEQARLLFVDFFLLFYLCQKYKWFFWRTLTLSLKEINTVLHYISFEWFFLKLNEVPNSLSFFGNKLSNDNFNCTDLMVISSDAEGSNKSCWAPKM